jgi:hypothetical protein
LGESFAEKSVARVLAVAALAGTVRLAKAGRAPVYFLFAGAYLATLLAWNYPPDQRFLVPVFPVLLAGFAEEFRRVAVKVRAGFAGRVPERIAAGAIAAAMGGLILAVGGGACFGLFRALPRFVADQRAERDGRQAVYQWFTANTPRDAAALAYYDPVFYLHTGRKACRFVISPALVYGGKRGAVERSLAGAADFAKGQGLSWAVLAPNDFFAELRDEERRTAFRALRTNPRFRPVYESGGVSVCRIE